MGGTEWLIPAIGVAISAIGTGVAAKQAHDQKKEARKAAQKQVEAISAFNTEKKQKNVATQEGEANRRRVLMETDTVKTSALGNTTGTQTQKKTLLGG